MNALGTLTTVPHTELLGEIVTWTMPTREVAYCDLVIALTAAGLPESTAKALRPTTAFSRAVRDLREGRTIDKTSRDKKTGRVTFQFTKKALDSAGLKLDFNYEALCHLDPDSGAITCPDSPEIQSFATTSFAHALAHRNASDITRLVQRLFETHADLYPINPAKGVAYFVPEAHRAFSAQVETFLQAMHGDLLRFPVPKGTAQGNRAVKESVESGLTALSHELEEAVDDWNDKTRASTFEKATAKWQQIKHKAEAYSEYLGDRQALLLAHLDEQKQRLAAKVNELMTARDAKAHRDLDGQQTMFPGATIPIKTDEVTPNAD